MKLTYNGFSYYKHRNLAEGRVYWRCEKSGKGCKAKAYTFPSGTKQMTRIHGVHTH